jgi:Domain of unknown function (DUF4184)
VPFTLSHPAAVLPLPRKHLVLSALVVGSMAPDFPYFIRLVEDTGRLGHSFAGLLYFCVPIGLVLLWLWHSMLKLPLLALAPRQLSTRVSPEDLQFRFGGWGRFAWILISLWIGAALHVFWDGFTHFHGKFIHLLPILNRPVYHGFPLYYVLQYVSSVVGLVVIAWSYLRWVRRTPAHDRPVVEPLSIARRIAVAVGAIAVALAIGAYTGKLARIQLPPPSFNVFVVKILIASLSVGFIELLLYAGWWHVAKRKSPTLFSTGD